MRDKKTEKNIVKFADEMVRHFRQNAACFVDVAIHTSSEVMERYVELIMGEKNTMGKLEMNTLIGRAVKNLLEDFDDDEYSFA
jgi:hypothetical protein